MLTFFFPRIFEALLYIGLLLRFPSAFLVCTKLVLGIWRCYRLYFNTYLHQKLLPLRNGFHIFLFMSSHPTQVLVIVIFHRKRRNMINAIIQKGSVEGNGRFFFSKHWGGEKTSYCSIFKWWNGNIDNGAATEQQKWCCI